jgi:hypothetical protein
LTAKPLASRSLMYHRSGVVLLYKVAIITSRKTRLGPASYLQAINQQWLTFVNECSRPWNQRLQLIWLSLEEQLKSDGCDGDGDGRVKPHRRGRRDICVLHKNTYLEVVPASDIVTGNFTEHSTALRFYCEWDAKNNIVLNAPCGLSRGITPPIYSELPCISDIEIRCEGLGIEERQRPAFRRPILLCERDGTGGNRLVAKLFTDPNALPTSLPKTAPNPCDNYDKYVKAHLKTDADCHSPIITTGLTT